MTERMSATTERMRGKIKKNTPSNLELMQSRREPESSRNARTDGEVWLRELRSGSTWEQYEALEQNAQHECDAKCAAAYATFKAKQAKAWGNRKVSGRTLADFDPKETKAWNEYQKTVEGAVKHYYEVTRIGLERLDKGERLVIKQKEHASRMCACGAADLKPRQRLCAQCRKQRRRETNRLNQQRWQRKHKRALT